MKREVGQTSAEHAGQNTSDRSSRLEYLSFPGVIVKIWNSRKSSTQSPPNGCSGMPHSIQLLHRHSQLPTTASLRPENSHTLWMLIRTTEHQFSVNSGTSNQNSGQVYKGIGTGAISPVPMRTREHSPRDSKQDAVTGLQDRPAPVAPDLSEKDERQERFQDPFL